MKFRKKAFRSSGIPPVFSPKADLVLFFELPARLHIFRGSPSFLHKFVQDFSEFKPGQKQVTMADSLISNNLRSRIWDCDSKFKA